MKYRIDYWRLPRDIDEIVKNKFAKDLIITICKENANPRSLEFLKNFEKRNDDFVLVSELIDGENDLNGREILEKYIRPRFPEARLGSWDEIE